MIKEKIPTPGIKTPSAEQQRLAFLKPPTEHSITGLGIGHSGIDTSRKGTEAFEKNRRNQITFSGDPATRHELVEQEINKGLDELAQPIEVPEITPVFLGLQKWIVERRATIVEKNARKHAEDAVVLKKADAAINSRVKYTGEDFQSHANPRRPKTRRQKVAVRKLNDAYDGIRSHKTRLAHYRETFEDDLDESLLQESAERLNPHSKLKLYGKAHSNALHSQHNQNLTLRERHNLGRGNRSALQIQQSLSKEERKREKLVSKPVEKMHKNLKKRHELSAKVHVLEVAQTKSREKWQDRRLAAKETMANMGDAANQATIKAIEGFQKKADELEVRAREKAKYIKSGELDIPKIQQLDLREVSKARARAEAEAQTREMKKNDS